MEGKKFVIPTCNDILCGRGRTVFNHPGNQKLRVKIAQTLDEYNICGSRQGRTRIIREIIRFVMVDQGGRFLKCDKKDSKIWYDGGIQVAKIRVSTAFRDARIPNKVKCMEALKKSYCATPFDVDYESSKLSTCSIYDPEYSLSSLSTYLMTTELIPYPSSENAVDGDTNGNNSLSTKLNSSQIIHISYPSDLDSISTDEETSLLFDKIDMIDFDTITIESRPLKVLSNDDTEPLKVQLNNNLSLEEAELHGLNPLLGRIISFNARSA